MQVAATLTIAFPLPIFMGLVPTQSPFENLKVVYISSLIMSGVHHPKPSCGVRKNSSEAQRQKSKVTQPTSGGAV